jgi:hypothetical protein
MATPFPRKTRHSLARRNAAHCFIGGPKRRRIAGSLQPEGYAQFWPNFFVKLKKYLII